MSTPRQRPTSVEQEGGCAEAEAEAEGEVEADAEHAKKRRARRTKL